jgi:ferrochelatase
MTVGVVLLNFGEPAEPEPEPVREYLERIFYNNATLERADTEAAARERAAELAERRLGPLLAEYEAIGGSPLNAQAQAQADALEPVLADRGYDVRTYLGTQFTEPFIADAVAQARADGVDELIGLPIYPLCGPSTTVDALADLRDAVAEQDWDVPVSELSGWHRHPTYNRLRAENVAAFADERGVALDDDATAFVCSAHGTPTHYLEADSRYDLYVEEFCDALAGILGTDYELGFQNHENRDIPWTEPEVEDLVEALGERDIERIVVEPVSFLHEQSETLSELDDELAETAAEVGLDFHRVPIPHDDERVPALLADLVEPLLAGFDPGYYQLRQCQCRDRPGTMCLNAPVDD